MVKSILIHSKCKIIINYFSARLHHAARDLAVAFLAQVIAILALPLRQDAVDKIPAFWHRIAYSRNKGAQC